MREPPVPPLITPLKVVLLLSPTVKVAVPKFTVVPVAALAKEPIVLLKVTKLKVAVPDKLTAEPVPNAVVEPAAKVPALIVVAPV